jgi:hypothetical protein
LQISSSLIRNKMINNKDKKNHNSEFKKLIKTKQYNFTIFQRRKQ